MEHVDWRLWTDCPLPDQALKLAVHGGGGWTRRPLKDSSDLN